MQMKKLLSIIVLGLFFSLNVAKAEISKIEKSYIGETTVSTVCIDGYKFVITSSKNGESIVQAYYRGGEGNIPLPEKC